MEMLRFWDLIPGKKRKKYKNFNIFVHNHIAKTQCWKIMEQTKKENGVIQSHKSMVFLNCRFFL